MSDLSEFEEVAGNAEAQAIEAFLDGIRQRLRGAEGHNGELPSVLVLIRSKCEDCDNSVVDVSYQNATIERRVWLMEAYKHALLSGEVTDAENEDEDAG